MRRFRPIHGLLFVALFVGVVWLVETLAGGLAYSSHQRVGPDAQGEVRLPVADLESREVRFYRFLNRGNQEVKFFVGRDEEGEVHVAFDANEICFKRKRGYEAEDGWLACRVCDKAFRLADVNQGGGGCKPVPVAHRVEDGELVLAEADLLQGWRFFR